MIAHIPKDERRKLDAKSIKCIFIGYCTDKKTYKLFDTSSHKLLASRDVVFHENADKNNEINDTSILSLLNDNESYVKIDAYEEHE